MEKTNQMLTYAEAAEFATLTLPIVGAYLVVQRPPARLVTTLVLAALALVPIYLHVVDVHVGDEVHVLNPVHAGWLLGGKGARHMPIHEFHGMHHHETGYLLLARRAASCWVAHPLFGVGGNNFPLACPVTHMDTLGLWWDRAVANNELLSFLAEHGGLGLPAVAWIAWIVMRHPCARFANELQAGCVAAYLATGLAGDCLEALCFATLLGVLLSEPSRADGCRATT